MSPTRLANAIEKLQDEMEQIREIARTTECYVLELMIYHQVLSKWLKSTSLTKQVKKLKDMNLLEPFWEQLKKMGFPPFSDSEKQKLLTTCLEGETVCA